MTGPGGRGGDQGPNGGSATLEPDREARAHSLAVLAPYRGRRGSPWSGVQALRGTLRHGKRLLLAMGLGMLAAVVLLCTVPLYSTLVGNIELQTALNAYGPAGRNIEVIGTNPTYLPNGVGYDRTKLDQLVRQAGSARLASFTAPAPTLLLVAGDLPVARIDTRAAIALPDQVQVTPLAYDYSQASAHLALIAGRLPRPPVTASAPPEALVTAQMARDRNIQVGAVLTVVETDGTSQLLRVVGIWQPKKPSESFWNGRGFVMVPQDVSQNSELFRYPLLMDQTALLTAFGADEARGIEQHWIYYTDPARITTGDIAAVADQVRRFHQQVETGAAALASAPANFGLPVGAQITLLTRLADVAGSTGSQLALLAQPLYVVVAQLEGLALLFVAAMGGLLVEAQGAEVATLRSRGASAPQILGGYALQSVGLMMLAVVAGPWLAGLLARGLVRLALPSATGVSLAPPAFFSAWNGGWAVVLPALAGAALGLAAVLVAAWQAVGLDVVAYRREQGRPLRPPFWRRLYLDVALAVICVLAYLDLGIFGGLDARQQLNQSGGSPLLYLAPALLLLACGLLALRVFPVLAGLGARIAARARGATGMLVFTQVARSARALGGPMRVALLLALGIGMAFFALAFAGSLEQNTADRAAYAVGADVRVTEAQAITGGDVTAARSALAGLPGVRGITPVFRGAARTNANVNGLPVGLLAVDPATWATAAGATSWRADDAADSPTALMAALAAHQWAGAGGSVGDAAHPLWALVSDTLAANLHLRAGQRFTLPVANTNLDQTTFIAGAIIYAVPTVYPAQVPGGFVVVGLGDAEGVGASPAIGPDEFWLQTAGSAAFAAALSQVAPNIGVIASLDRRQIQSRLADSPLVAGMRGLLTVGVALMVMLALLASVVQAALLARRRRVQFAVLRSLGMRAGQVRRIVLGEQTVVCLFGVVGGTLFGVGLAVATLPYLQFGDNVLDATTVGVPPERLVVDAANLGWFYGALLVGCALALIATAVAARRAGIGTARQTLRLGED